MSQNPSNGHIFLVGFMGAGKSTVGRILAEHLGRPFIDLDAEISREAGRAVAKIFAEDGEEAFRALESDELQRIVERPPSVVACGGGIVLRDENRRLMKDIGTVVSSRSLRGRSAGANRQRRRSSAAGGRRTVGREHAAAGASGAVPGGRRHHVDTDACEPVELAEQIAAALATSGRSR